MKKKTLLVFGIISMFLLTSAVPFAIAVDTKVNVGNIREQISPLNDPPSERWSKTYGGDDYDSGYDIQITTDGGYIVVGSISPYMAEWDDVWLIKLDKYGNIIWDKTYGTDEHGETGYSVQQTDDGGYIISGDGDGIWLIKTDSDGNIEWDKTYEDTGSGYCVRQTSDGGYIITGSGYVEGDIDACLIKTDSQGNLEWKKTFGGDFWDYGRCVSQTNDSGYIMTGAADYDSDLDPSTSDLWLLKTDSNGNKEWEKKFGGDYIDEGCYLQETTDGGYIITGYTLVGEIDIIDVWLIKTDDKGNKIWDKKYIGMLGAEDGSCVQQTTDGGYIITGTIGSWFSPNTGYDILLIKTDQFGDLQWKKTYNRGDWDFGNSVKQTNDGGYIIVGDTDGTASGYDDIWVIKTDSKGNTQSKALTHSLSLRILEKLLDQFPMLARLLNLL